MTDSSIKEPSGAIWKGQDEYEEARGAIVWQLKKPERYPDVLVKAHNEQEVLDAVRWAKEKGLKVMARSGGHSWAGTSVREGGMNISLDAMRDIEIDEERMIASVGPATHVEVLEAALAERGLFFPLGHCPTVAVGGFLLGGGYGWWGQEYGQACLSIEALDIVTADGELIRADAKQNTDYFWMARGAGPSFFGVVTRFHLKLRPRFTSIVKTIMLMPRTEMDAVFKWAWKAREEFDGKVEFAIGSRTIDDPMNPGKRLPVLGISATAIGDSDEEARERLRPMLECHELRAKAVDIRMPFKTTLAKLYAQQDEANPPGFRYAVDNMWTNASAEEVLPMLREAYDWLPTEESLVLWYSWKPQPLPDAAVSTHANLWVSVYATYSDPADDERHQEFVTDLLGRYQHLSPGSQISDENMAARFHNPVSPQSLAKLRELKKKLDPNDMFHGFLGMPAEDDAL